MTQTYEKPAQDLTKIPTLQETTFEAPPPPYEQETTPVSDLRSDVQGLTIAKTRSGSRLQKPIAIPATANKLGSPFLRAYPPTLEHFEIPKDVFLDFLDDLNKVAVASPPLRVLGLAGNIVGFIPIQEAQIVSGAVGVATGLGTYVLSKGRTEMLLRKVNKKMFSPRGLKVEVAKIDALAKIANMPILNADGKVDKETPLLNPVESWELKSSVTGQDRRLRAFEPYIAQLDLTNLPEVAVSRNPLSKWSSNASERQRKKEERRMLKSRQKAYRKGSERPAKAERKHERKLAKLDDKAELAKCTNDSRKLARIERRRAKAEKRLEKRMDKAEKAPLKTKEEKDSRKMLWLIIRNLDADSGPGPDPYTDDVPEEEGDSDFSEDETSGSSQSTDSADEVTK